MHTTVNSLTSIENFSISVVWRILIFNFIQENVRFDFRWIVIYLNWLFIIFRIWAMLFTWLLLLFFSFSFFCEIYRVFLWDNFCNFFHRNFHFFFHNFNSLFLGHFLILNRCSSRRNNFFLFSKFLNQSSFSVFFSQQFFEQLILIFNYFIQFSLYFLKLQIFIFNFKFIFINFLFSIL